jgi:hypothetical protein
MRSPLARLGLLGKRFLVKGFGRASDHKAIAPAPDTGEGLHDRSAFSFDELCQFLGRLRAGVGGVAVEPRTVDEKATHVKFANHLAHAVDVIAIRMSRENEVHAIGAVVLRNVLD